MTFGESVAAQCGVTDSRWLPGGGGRRDEAKGESGATSKRLEDSRIFWGIMDPLESLVKHLDLFPE